MRILYFYRVRLPDARADAIQIVNTCAGLARAGCDVRLHVEEVRAGSRADCLAFYGIPDGTWADGALEVAALGRHWSWPFLALRTRRVLREAAGAPGCLFVREVRPYVPGLAARAKAAGLKVIVEAHNVSAALVREKRLEAEAARRAALEAAILSAADGLVCTQRATLEGLRGLLPPGLPAVVEANATQIPPQRPEGARDLDILYCGSLKPWKGVDLLVSALPLLAPHRLTIVGPATREDGERVRRLALALRVNDRVELLPSVGPAGVWDLYARARVGVVPLPNRESVEARDFTSPLKLFEMMAAGLPIVASRLPSLEEYVTADREAALVAPDDAHALAEGIGRVLRDGAYARGLAAAARARVTEHTWERRGVRLAAFAEELFTAHRRR